MLDSVHHQIHNSFSTQKLSSLTRKKQRYQHAIRCKNGTTFPLSSCFSLQCRPSQRRLRHLLNYRTLNRLPPNLSCHYSIFPLLQRQLVPLLPATPTDGLSTSRYQLLGYRLPDWVNYPLGWISANPLRELSRGWTNCYSLSRPC